MAKGAVHLYLTGGLGNMPMAILADNNRIFTAVCLADRPGLDLGCLFGDKIHGKIIFPDQENTRLLPPGQKTKTGCSARE